MRRTDIGNVAAGIVAGTVVGSIMAVNPLLGEAMRLAVSSSERTKEAAESGDEKRVRQAQGQQEMDLRLAEQQARVAQEMAIAQRIYTADEVEIEEFYEGSGEGAAGVGADQTGLKASFSGSGRRVTKRVYRFKGWQEGAFALLQTDNPAESPEPSQE